MKGKTREKLQIVNKKQKQYLKKLNEKEIKKNYKIFQAFKIFKSHIFDKKIPLSVNFRITHRCNFRCNYCEVWKNSEEEMNTEEVMRCIDKFASLGTLKFTFTGGEPLLRGDIKNLIDYAKQKGIRIHLVSNGYLIKEKINEIRNIDLLVLSLDGKEKIHDEQRRKGSYKKVMEAIEIAKENKIKVLTLTVLTKSNLNQIEFILDKAKESKFLANFQPVFEYSQSSSVDKYLPNPKELENCVKLLIDKKKNGLPVACSFDYLDLLLNYPNYPNLKCLAGKRYCVVTPTGSVFPCGQLAYKVKGYNGLKLGFGNAFNSLGKYDHCNGCWYSCFNEYNFLFSLRFGAIINAIKNEI